MSFVKNWFKSIWIPRSVADLQWFYKVNPDLTSSLGKATEFRAVAPGSQPLYSAPESDKISKNYYFNRDARRDYPRTVVYTASDISGLLSSSIKSLPAPASAGEPPATLYNESKLPPILNFRREYKPAASYLAPNEVNPELSIVGRT